MAQKFSDEYIRGVRFAQGYLNDRAKQVEQSAANVIQQQATSDTQVEVAVGEYRKLRAKAAMFKTQAGELEHEADKMRQVNVLEAHAKRVEFQTPFTKAKEEARTWRAAAVEENQMTTLELIGAVARGY